MTDDHSDQPAWEILAEGVVLPVHAQPGARRNGVRGVRSGRLLVAVTSAPEKGKANEAILVVLAECLQVRPRQVSLISGETNSKKRVLITGADPADLAARVAALLADI